MDRLLAGRGVVFFQALMSGRFANALRPLGIVTAIGTLIVEICRPLGFTEADRERLRAQINKTVKVIGSLMCGRTGASGRPRRA
jgi:uncharacterized membrane protein YcjF (UPF0283 family)